MGAARPGLRGYRLWVTALHVVARRPVRLLAPLCVVGLGVCAGTAISAALLLLVPAPAAVVMVLATWTSVAGTTARPADPLVSPPDSDVRRKAAIDAAAPGTPRR